MSKECSLITNLLHLLTILCLIADKHFCHYCHLHSKGVTSQCCVLMFIL